MSKRQFLKALGPGLMWAGTAVGVSHLVQSTRAGANYGFYFLGILVLANVIKYPFFEFAPRYAAATGQHLIDGYNRIGKWAVWLYAVLTFATMFTIQAAVTIVTAGLLKNLLHIDLSTTAVSVILLAVIMLILLAGKFSTLDKLVKFIVLLLSLSVIVAVISAFGHGFHPDYTKVRPFEWTNPLDIAFLIAFIGWMPAPIDVAVWHSYWSVEKQRDTGYRPALQEALLDFNIGYVGTVLLAIGFLSLGALVMYGTGVHFAQNGVTFAGQLVSLFTKNIGSWAYPVISIAAFTTMFSTTLTCLDAYSKVLKPTTEYLVPGWRTAKRGWTVWAWLFLVVTGALLLIDIFASRMKVMVDIATTLSFVTAPFLAFLNYKAVTSKEIPGEYRPGKRMRLYAVTGIVFLTLFSLFYVLWRFA